MIELETPYTVDSFVTFEGFKKVLDCNGVWVFDCFAQDADEIVQRVNKHESLLSRIRNLENALSMLSIGSCNCLTKTNDPNYHKSSCRYKMIQDALSPPIKDSN